MYSILISKKNNYHWFFSDVSKTEYCQYLHFVAVELNMKLIMKRIMFDYYRSVRSLKFDIDYVVKNAGIYNSVNSDIYDLASQMRNELIKVIDTCI